jgi:hypothetical protein
MMLVVGVVCVLKGLRRSVSHKVIGRFVFLPHVYEIYIQLP